jgi:hypothetical protein
MYIIGLSKDILLTCGAKLVKVQVGQIAQGVVHAYEAANN